MRDRSMGAFMAKLVRSTMESPTSRIWGSTARTSKMEITVPRPRQVPMAAMTGFVVIAPIRAPATARMVPEVKMVGKAWFRAVIMAFWMGISFFSSV